MPFLIDGDNLLGTALRPRSDGEKRKLAAELARFARKSRRRVIIVYDGNPPHAAGFGGHVMFAGSGRTADDVIVERLKSEKDRRGWIVVTNDRSLGDRCRWLEATHEKCDRFRARLADAGESEKPVSETDIDYWLEQFGATEEDEGSAG